LITTLATVAVVIATSMVGSRPATADANIDIFNHNIEWNAEGALRYTIVENPQTVYGAQDIVSRTTRV
jgi:hypothetical protein